jgi:hypothetical protein
MPTKAGIIIHTVDMGQPLGPLKHLLAERGIAKHVVQPLQPKADYAQRYAQNEPQSWGPCTYHCRFLAAPLMRYYDITGLEMPCCFIKDTAEFTSNEQLRQQLNRHIVPAVCQGCSAIFPHAKVSVAQLPSIAKSH